MINARTVKTSIGSVTGNITIYSTGHAAGSGYNQSAGRPHHARDLFSTCIADLIGESFQREAPPSERETAGTPKKNAYRNTKSVGEVMVMVGDKKSLF
jgi:hypothetical protein